MIRTAFVLGAGLGTRLRPLTSRRPKPLIPLAGRPLLSHAFDHLLDSQLGVERFVVNTHWCAERYLEFFPDRQWRGIPIHFVHEAPVVLETAGAIWHAREHLQEGPFLVYNGDIFTDLPLAPAVAAHAESGFEVTLVLRSHGANCNVAFNPETRRVPDLRRALRPEVTPAHLFTGISIMEPEFIERIPPDEAVSVVPVFHGMIRAQVPVGGIVLDAGCWGPTSARAKNITKFVPPSAISRRFGTEKWLRK